MTTTQVRDRQTLVRQALSSSRLAEEFLAKAAVKKQNKRHISEYAIIVIIIGVVPAEDIDGNSGKILRLRPSSPRLVSACSQFI